MNLIKDSGSYTDAYWQKSVSDHCSQAQQQQGPVYAPTEGGHDALRKGEAGHRIAHDARGEGLCEAVMEQRKRQGLPDVSASVKEQSRETVDKVRVCGQITTVEFKKEVIGVIQDGEPRMKRLAAVGGESVLAIMTRTRPGPIAPILGRRSIRQPPALSSRSRALGSRQHRAGGPEPTGDAPAQLIMQVLQVHGRETQGPN